MYVVKEGAFYVLRQLRFLGRTKEHPHDICAVARSLQEMHEMADKHWPDIDYSRVECHKS